MPLPCSRFLLPLLLASCWPLAASAAETLRPEKRLVVVMDDNYPPYVFRGPDGRVQGYLVDSWQLWQRKTGIPVELGPRTGPWPRRTWPRAGPGDRHHVPHARARGHPALFGPLRRGAGAHLRPQGHRRHPRPGLAAGLRGGGEGRRRLRQPARGGGRHPPDPPGQLPGPDRGGQGQHGAHVLHGRPARRLPALPCRHAPRLPRGADPGRRPAAPGGAQGRSGHADPGREGLCRLHRRRPRP
jgi:hypothetical protein